MAESHIEIYVVHNALESLRFFLQRGADPRIKAHHESPLTRFSIPFQTKMIEWGFAKDEDF